jgi:hypothetical protein
MPPESGPAVEPREYLGAVYKTTVEFLRARGVLEQVKAQLSQATVRALEKPAFALAFQSGAALDEIVAVVDTLPNGRELNFALGNETSRGLAGSIIAPVLKMALSLFGNTPASIFRNLDRFFAVAARGMDFAYEEVSANEGVVIARASGQRVPRGILDVTRGNLVTVFELCSTTGTVGEAEEVVASPTSTQVRIPVRWV